MLPLMTVENKITDDRRQELTAFLDDHAEFRELNGRADSQRSDYF